MSEAAGSTFEAPGLEMGRRRGEGGEGRKEGSGNVGGWEERDDPEGWRGLAAGLLAVPVAAEPRGRVALAAKHAGK
jgi:hypothetical protein